MRRLDIRVAVLGLAALLLAWGICAEVLPQQNQAGEEGAESTEVATAKDDVEGLGSGDAGAAEYSEVFEKALSAETTGSSFQAFLGDLASAEPQRLSGDAASPAGSCAVAWEAAGDLPDNAAELLQAYAGVSDAQLLTSGYLDLFGIAWGAVLRLDVETIDIATAVCDEGGETTELRVVRLETLG